MTKLAIGIGATLAIAAYGALSFVAAYYQAMYHL